MTEVIDVRAAVGDEAEEVARVHVQAWREAYVGIVPQAVLDRRDKDVSVERWRSIIESGSSTVRVAVRSGQVVGWATSGPSRDDDAPASLELYGIYSVREVYGSGVGQRLLEAAIGTTEAATLWVLEANARARRFYERNGFVPDGARKMFAIGGDQIPEIRMLRPGT